MKGDTDMPSPTPFHKILIANRGEIALRVMRSARSLGYRTVAVYSTADAQSRHVREADQAVWIGQSQPAQSYLNIAALIAAAQASGADAVHPGYGFLAENAHFAQACVDAGLVFIGPSAKAITAMGNKAHAKRLMSDAGVPCVPGYQGDDQSPEHLAQEAQRIGFPVMIKATAGGGGRGMRLAASAAAFADLLRSAKSEARNAFGDDTVILERAIVDARHIEIQIMADRHGHAIHLGERDCSVQRRHQKLIEEAPSPAVSAPLRERMGATAVAAVKAIAYEGAGTLEFLLDAQGQFYFMEMNTRLQVEHPVTEALTGLDLVELQLRIAAGEPLTIAQEDVRFDGHAIEVRLCAEDAGQSFMPQSGTIALWQPAPSLRTEHALESGCTVSPYYDSMIAKIIGHGSTREEARRKLVAGLQDTVVLGVTTNQAFLARCLQQTQFVQGEATTTFIDTNLPELIAAHEAGESRACALAALLLVATSPGASQQPGARLLPHSLPTSLRLEVNGHSMNAAFKDLGNALQQVQIGERTHEMALIALDSTKARFICDGVMESAAYARDDAHLFLHMAGTAYPVLDTSRAATVRKGSDAVSDGKLRATMNGRIVAVFVGLGDAVTAGQPLVTLEAMKMEHVHTAPMAGIVTALHVNTGEQVAARHVLLEIRDP